MLTGLLNPFLFIQGSQGFRVFIFLNSFDHFSTKEVTRAWIIIFSDRKLKFSKGSDLNRKAELEPRSPNP